MANIIIDKHGKIMLPTDMSGEMHAYQNRWFKLSVQGNHLVLSPPQELDEELQEQLIGQGIIF